MDEEKKKENSRNYMKTFKRIFEVNDDE